MKLLYMKNDCLCASPFREDYHRRILDYCETAAIKHIFISGRIEDKESSQLFLKACEQAGIEVILSPWKDDIEKIPALMDQVSLYIYLMGNWNAVNGMAFEIDTQKRSSRIIYMDLFLKHIKYVNAENLEEELNELLHDILHSHKKSNQYH